MNDGDIAAYLARLGLEREPPSADALRRLHRAEVENVPYETVWLHLGEPWTVDASESVRRVAHLGRGGYCFHVNGAFSEMLRALGYDVTRHVGGVHGPDGPSEDAMANHLVLTAAGLPSDDNPEGEWYVDVGLGDALHEPLPLHEGDYSQGPFRYTLKATPGQIGDWHFTHDPRGSFPGMTWRSAPAEMRDFAEKHTFLSTSPESGFVKLLSVQRRDADGADVMVGLVLRRVEDGEPAPPHSLTDRSEWFDALTDVFHLRLDGAEPQAIDRLWERTLAAHRAWEEKQATNPR